MHPRNSPAVPSRGVLVNALRVLWIAVVLWCEVGVFFYSLRSCTWPDAAIPARQHGTPAHVLLISDPQINHSPAQGRLPTSWAGVRQALSHADMRKAWRLTRRLAPHAVICLGDMLASGRTAQSDQEYEEQYNAFREVFPLDGAVPMYYLPGNNDVGLGRSPTISTRTRARYTRHFGPPNQVLRLGGHDLVLLDAPGLVEEDYQRHARAKKGKRQVQVDSDYAGAGAGVGVGVGVGAGVGAGAGGGAYAGYEGVRGGAVEFVKGLIGNATAEGDAPPPRILLTHIPLAHPESARGGTACGPLRERGGTLRRGVGRGWQNTLDRATSEFLLGGVRPRAVFSGDDRDYCEYTHPHPHPQSGGEGVREVTIKSFSLANNIRRPGFQLLALAAPNPSQHQHQQQHQAQENLETTGKTWADAPCALPDRRALLTTLYLPLSVLTALALLLSNLVRPNLRLVRASSKGASFEGKARPGALHLAPFAFTPPAGPSAPGTPWGPLSPFTPFPDAHSGSAPASASNSGRPKMNVRIPSAAGSGVGMALGVGLGLRSGSTSGTDTPLLTPSAHGEDGGGYAHWAGDAEGDGEGMDVEGDGEFFPHQYDADHRARARTHWPNGEHAEEYGEEYGEEGEGVLFAQPHNPNSKARPQHSRATSKSYFLPAPSTSPRTSPGALAGGGSGSEAWAWTCSFVLRGRRRRITLRAPTLGALLDLRELARDAWGAGTGRGGIGGLGRGLGGRRGVGAVGRGVLGDALRVLGPTGAVWWAAVWLAF